MNSQERRLRICRFLAERKKEWGHLNGPLDLMLQNDETWYLFAKLDKEALARSLFSKNTNRSDRFYSLYKLFAVTRQLMREGKL